MTFKLKTFAAVGALIGSLALVGCGQDEKDPNHIKVGVIVGAEQQVAETAVKVAKEKYGLDGIGYRVLMVSSHKKDGLQPLEEALTDRFAQAITAIFQSTFGFAAQFAQLFF
jgi:hypothetical protein